jgi:anti-sigma regulatory factor (Ser/Thr protein kinase)
VIDTAAWHRDLAAGTLDIDLDTSSDLYIFMVIDVVNSVMREKRYLEPTARRVRIILQELLRNVARHVPDQYARVHVALRETHLRGVVIDVGDNGPGIPNDVLGRYTQLLLAGEREHGLLLVSRLASSFHNRLPESWRIANHIGCDVIEPRPFSSVLTRNRQVGLVRIEYSSPQVLWIGPEESYVFYDNATSLQRLFEAAHDGLVPVLAPYFNPVRDASHLAVEVSGRDVGTEVSAFWNEVVTVIAVAFPDRIAQQRVVVLAQDADWSLHGPLMLWAQEKGLRWFNDETSASAYLAAQTAG